jgi:hypothetical protein
MKRKTREKLSKYFIYFLIAAFVISILPAILIR